MPLRALFLLSRTRIYFAAVASLFITLGAFFLTSANGVSDVRVLWDRFCGCPLERSDAAILIHSPFFLALVASFILMTPVGNAATPGLKGGSLFLLTRPTTRLRVVVLPLLFSSAVVFLLPLLTWAILVGWLALVHAPVMEHLRGLMQLAASVAHPDYQSHPLWLSLDLGRRSLALASDVLCACTLLGSLRWFALSSSTTFKIIAALIPILLPLSGPMLGLFSKRALSACFLIPTRGQGLTYLPSTLGIVTHFAFAAAWLAVTLYAMRQVEL